MDYMVTKAAWQAAGRLAIGARLTGATAETIVPFWVKPCIALMRTP